MKVDLGSIEISDLERLLLNMRHGKPGLAGRTEVRELIKRAIDERLRELHEDAVVLARVDSDLARPDNGQVPDDVSATAPVDG